MIVTQSDEARSDCGRPLMASTTRIPIVEAP
jgi:hypothetical protein